MLTLQTSCFHLQAGQCLNKGRLLLVVGESAPLFLTSLRGDTMAQAERLLTAARHFQV